MDVEGLKQPMILSESESESDISCNSSDDYQPPSSRTEETDSGSCSNDSESESDQDTDNDGTSNPSTTACFEKWGPCTLQIQKFGFTGSKDPEINITEADLYKICRYFLTDEILQLIVTETNHYAQQFISSHQLRRHSLMRKWKDTTAKEMETLLAVLAIMGVNPLPQLHLHWSKNKRYRNLQIVE